MDGVCGNLNRCHCCISNNFAQISRCCARHVCTCTCLYAWNIMAQNNNIAVQVVAHAIDITCDECLVACTPAKEPRNNPAITHCILYFIISNHDLYDLYPYDFFQLHTFMTNTTNSSGDDPLQPAYSTTIELSMPILTLPHMSLTYLHPPLLSSSSHLIRETSSSANQNMHT
jgi:hypothetical protein